MIGKDTTGNFEEGAADVSDECETANKSSKIPTTVCVNRKEHHTPSQFYSTIIISFQPLAEDMSKCCKGSEAAL